MGDPHITPVHPHTLLTISHNYDDRYNLPDTMVVAVVAKEAWKTNLANVHPISSSSVESVKK